MYQDRLTIDYDIAVCKYVHNDRIAGAVRQCRSQVNRVTEQSFSVGMSFYSHAVDGAKRWQSRISVDEKTLDCFSQIHGKDERINPLAASTRYYQKESGRTGTSRGHLPRGQATGNTVALLIINEGSL